MGGGGREIACTGDIGVDNKAGGCRHISADIGIYSGSGGRTSD